jgi:hypothetical protein
MHVAFTAGSLNYVRLYVVTHTLSLLLFLVRR